MILTVLAATLIAVSASAVTLQRIEVRGAQRVSARVIIDETLLREGGDYSDDELRDAVARVRRLPFILAADDSLQNGTLTITVTETRRLNFLVDARGIYLHGNVVDNDFDYDFPDPAAEWTNAAAGARWFLGNGGDAHFGLTVLRNRHAFGRNYSAYELGYTQRDILGTRVFATLNVRSPVDSLEEKTFTPEFSVGLPLTARQTVTAGIQDTLFFNNTFHIGGVDLRRLHAERLVTLAWTYDTRDQAMAATRGTFVRIAPMHWMRDDASFSFFPSGPAPNASHINANGLDAAALRYWDLSGTSSVSAGLLGSWARLEDPRNRRSTPAYEVVEGGWSHALGAARIAIDGRWIFRQHDPAREKHSYEAAASWTRRTAWATLRFGVAYASGH